MSSHQLEIPSAAALVIVAGLVVATVWTVPHQVVGQENIETKSHIDGKLVEPGNSVNGEVEDIRGTDHYKVDIEQPGKLTVNVSKSEGNESKLFASVHRMETHRLINYTTLERGGKLTAEITNPGMHYVEIKGDGYTNYSFTVNFDPSETNESTTDTPTETTDTPTETTDTPIGTTDTPTKTTDTPTETTDTPTKTTDTPTKTTGTPTETT
ncbi:hypothetical protein, partial [Halocatena pleomorpha]|uniref:hypothetical protein n=1 Tax=Halocatena pleomorpha TaxID=1785090 RepID=UPI00163B0A6A